MTYALRLEYRRFRIPWNFECALPRGGGPRGAGDRAARGDPLPGESHRHVAALVAKVEAARRRLESAFALVREKHFAVLDLPVRAR